MLIRYFAAAQAAAGVDEERVSLPDGSTLANVLQMLIREHPQSSGKIPALETVIACSSFLRNEIACRDHSVVLDNQDIIDILPPFAGG
jgi:molybdopterin converting factor small subunit